VSQFFSAQVPITFTITDFDLGGSNLPTRHAYSHFLFFCRPCCCCCSVRVTECCKSIYCCCAVTTRLYPPRILWQSPTQQIALRGESWSVKCIFAGRSVQLTTWF